uniref:Uncharacterized protein n=1 Tax=Romanomermis culicivorax TaxID=13658 RepID=A0A915JCA1_ROMCU
MFGGRFRRFRLDERALNRANRVVPLERADDPRRLSRAGSRSRRDHRVLKSFLIVVVCCVYQAPVGGMIKAGAGECACNGKYVEEAATSAGGGCRSHMWKG